MKKVSIYILLLLGVFFASCNGNGYSNELEEEEQLIEEFIARQGIIVVTEEPVSMEEWGEKVYWKLPDYDNFYFHLVERGDTTKAELEAKDNVLLRYIQYTLEAYADTMRFWNSDDQPEPTRLQYLVATDASCTGWQIALEHLKYSGAQCKIICPSKLGFSEHNTTVTPYGYDMKIQIKRY